MKLDDILIFFGEKRTKIVIIHIKNTIICPSLL